MDKPDRKEYLRYRVWLWEHAPDNLKHNRTRKGYSEAPNKDYLEIIPCRECKQPFHRELPWQRRCDNCIRSDVLEGGVTNNEYKITSIREIFTGGTLRAEDIPSNTDTSGNGGKPPIKVAQQGRKTCRKCGGSIFDPTPGCDGCYSYKQMER